MTSRVQATQKDTVKKVKRAQDGGKSPEHTSDKGLVPTIQEELQQLGNRGTAGLRTDAGSEQTFLQRRYANGRPARGVGSHRGYGRHANRNPVRHRVTPRRVAVSQAGLSHCQRQRQKRRRWDRAGHPRGSDVTVQEHSGQPWSGVCAWTCRVRTVLPGTTRRAGGPGGREDGPCETVRGGVLLQVDLVWSSP